METGAGADPGNKRGQRNSQCKTPPVKKIKIKEEPVDDYDEDEILLPPGTWRRPSDEPKKNLTLEGLRHLLQNCMIVQTKTKGQTVVIIRGDEEKEREEKNKDKDKDGCGGFKGDEAVEGGRKKRERAGSGSDDGVDNCEKKLFTNDVDVVTLSDSPVKDPEEEVKEKGTKSKISTDAPTVSRSTFVPVRLSSVALQCMRASENSSSGSVASFRQSLTSYYVLNEAPKLPVSAPHPVSGFGNSCRRGRKRKSAPARKDKTQVKRDADETPAPAPNNPEWLALRPCRILLTRCDEVVLGSGDKNMSNYEATEGPKKRNILKKVRNYSSEANSKSKRRSPTPLVEDACASTPTPRLHQNESESPPIPVDQRRGYECEICFRALRSESHLRTHMLSHITTAATTTAGKGQGGRPYCEVCGKEFLYQSYLNVHYKSVGHRKQLKINANG